MLGQLDDVLLIELAWPAFASEVEDFRDFCAYRKLAHQAAGPPSSAQHGSTTGSRNWRCGSRRMRCVKQHYAPPWSTTSTLFRVG